MSDQETYRELESNATKEVEEKVVSCKSLGSSVDSRMLMKALYTSQREHGQPI